LYQNAADIYNKYQTTDAVLGREKMVIRSLKYTKNLFT